LPNTRLWQVNCYLNRPQGVISEQGKDTNMRTWLGCGRLGLLAVLVGAILALAAPAANADSLSFQLTSDHCTGGCLGGAPSAGTITVTSNATGTLIFNVTLNSGFKFVSTGFQTDFGFNLVGNPSITFSGVTTGFAPNANPETAGSLHMDGAGDFEYGVNCTACGSGGSNPQSGPLNFTITGTGLTLASLEKNGTSQFFAVDVLGNGNTGAVDASSPSVPTPEPSSFLLLGTALTGLAAVGRFARRFRA
jgi:hypothetical protein